MIGINQKAALYLAKSHAVKTKQLNDNNQAQTQFLLHSFDNKKKEKRILQLEKNASKIMFFSGFLLWFSSLYSYRHCCFYANFDE